MIEKITLDYSMKNIPLPSKNSYKAKLLLKVESVIKRMRRKAFLNESDKNERNKYNLPTRKSPPQVELLKPFVNEFLDMVENIQY